MNNILIGMAGHIDHGKTTFIEKMTNKNLDTLPEEKSRNMTIDIGFTDLDLDSDTKVGLVDVPGHEKFIKNMASGISGVNFVILIIAVDDGIMPQTIEHFEIIKLMNIKNGIVVLTKKDLVSKERFIEVKKECEKFFENSFFKGNIYSVDINDRKTYDDIKKIILEKIKKSDNVNLNKSNFRMNVDRVFNVRGVGKILTGTILTGEIFKNDIKRIYPQNIEVRIKNIQNHGVDVNSLSSYKRCALNIATEKIEIKRGDIIADFLYITDNLDVNFFLLPKIKKIKNNHRIRINIGTKEVIGRVVIIGKNYIFGGEKCFAKLLLDEKIAVDFRDIGIVRDFSPVTTIGNIIVINPNSKLKSRYDEKYTEMLNLLNVEDELEFLENRVYYGKYENFSEDNIQKLIANKKIILLDKKYITHRNFEELSEKIEKYLIDFHRDNHLKLGEDKNILYNTFVKEENLTGKDFEKFLELSDFKIDKEIVSLKNYKIKLTKEEKKIKEEIFSIYKNQKFDLKKFDRSVEYDEIFIKMHRYMVENNFIINLGNDYYILSGFLKECNKILEEYFVKNKELTISKFREILKINRNSAIILLEYLDKVKFTRKIGNYRVLRKN